MYLFSGIFELLLFCLASFFCFYITGSFILKRLKLVFDPLDGIFLSNVVGIVFFTLTAYVLSWVGVSFLVLAVVVIIFVLSVREKIISVPRIEKKQRKPLLVVLVLSLLFSCSMLLTGVFGDSITYRRDDLFHLALINELVAHFPPDNPGTSGVPLFGYHFFYNFLLAKISNLFFLPATALYFHFFPLLVALLWGIGVYSLVFRWTKRIAASLWAVFFSFFGGSLSFVLPLMGRYGLSLDDAFGMTQPASSLVNPPFAISILLVIATCFSILSFFQTKQKGWILLASIFIGIATMFKVYAGIILLGSFIVLTFFTFLKKREHSIVLRKDGYVFARALVVIGFLFASTYWIFRDPSSHLFLAPLWSPHKVLEDNITWYGYTEKQYTYSQLGVIKGIIQIEVEALSIFILGSLGTRIIGILAVFFFFFRKMRSLSMFALFLLSSTAISLVIPLFFLQSGKVFEIIQLAWYFLFFCSLVAGVGIGEILSLVRNNFFKAVIGLVIILVTLPSAYEKFSGYITRGGMVTQSYADSYQQTLRMLSGIGSYNDTVLELPDKTIDTSLDSLKRWYGKTTPGVVAFANKRGYLNNEYIEFPGQNIHERLRFLQRVLLGDVTIADLKKEGIVFILSPNERKNLEGIEGIKTITNNDPYRIYSPD